MLECAAVSWYTTLSVHPQVMRAGGFMSLKDKILIELENSRLTALSGQALAVRFGVSRNAIWKAVNTLKQEGYAISSTQNLGYQLSPLCDRLSAGSIRELLTDTAMPVFAYEKLDSTNNQAKRLLADGTLSPFVVVAEEQTAGRGRHGRTFFSPKGAGLYVTVALAAGQAAQSILNVTAYAAVCVAQAIQHVTGQQVQIKWVNDLFLDGKKVCGILTEATTDFEAGTVESLLVGIGINIRQSDVPESWKDTVGFLNCDMPMRNRLCAEVTNRLCRYPVNAAQFMAQYRERSLTLGRQVLCIQGEMRFEGIAMGIDPDGALLVQTPQGEMRTLRSGEIQFLPDGRP